MRLLLMAAAMSLAGGATAQSQAGAYGAAGAPAKDDGPPAVPRENFLSSLKQAFGQDVDHAVVFGHFDVGTAPDAHRYYCVLDPKTGKRQPNGVAGAPLPRPDGMTGIKVSAVSLYGCASAEQQGLLVTDGYVLKVPILGSPPVGAPPTPTGASASGSPVTPDQVDVAGVKLGMAPDQVRAALKSKQLRDYYESTGTLSRTDPATGVSQPIQGGRFVNVIAVWAAAPGAASAPGAGSAPGEFYEVQFTPVPGKEQAMAIMHSVGYSPDRGVRESILDGALVRKYGGFGGPGEFPDSPTWRIRSNGDVQVGDTCNARDVATLPRGVPFEDGVRSNPALTTEPMEFRHQIDNCGVAMVTEDHVAADSSAARDARVVTRFTITAYAPAIAALGAAAARQLIEGASVVPNARAGSPTPAL